MNNLEKKLEIVVSMLADLRTDIELIKLDLRHHVKRSDLNEEAVKLLRSEVEKQATDIRQEMKPAMKLVTWLDVSMKVIGAVSILIGLYLAVESING